MGVQTEREIPREQVDAALRRSGAAELADPALQELATTRVLWRINSAVADRQAHSDLALAPEHAFAARYGRIGNVLAPTARIDEAGPGQLEELLEQSLPEDPVLRAPAAMTGPGHTLHVPDDAARRIAADRSLGPVARAEALAAAGVAPIIIDVLCYERARVSATLEVRADAADAEPATGWTGMWVLTLNGLYAVRFDARPEDGAADGEALAAFQAVAVGDVMQQLIGRTGAAFHFLGALERERAAGGEEA